MHLYDSMQTLITLDLSNNRISGKGAEKLANALHHNTVRWIFYTYLFYAHLYHSIQTLTALDLRDNEIDDKGVEYLDNALQHNTVRRVLFPSFS